MLTNRYIFPMLLVILSGLLYVQYVEGAYANIRLSKEQSAELDKMLNSSAEVVALQDELYATLNGLSSVDIARLEKIFPKSLDPVRVIYDLNSIAARHSLVIKNPSVTQPPREETANPNDPRITQVKFTIAAPYFVFKEFLSDLEKSIVITDVTGIAIAGAIDKAAQESQPLLYTVDGVIYSYE